MAGHSIGVSMGDPILGVYMGARSPASQRVPPLKLEAIVEALWADIPTVLEGGNASPRIHGSSHVVQMSTGCSAAEGG